MSMKLSLSDRLAARNPHKALARAVDLQQRGEHVRAFKLYAIAAEAGITQAERELGFKVLPVDDAMRSAVEWFLAHGYAPRP